MLRSPEEQPHHAPRDTSSAMPRPFWGTATFRWSAMSSLLIWLAFPPVGLWWLAWLGPMGWIRLVRMPRLDGRRPYAVLYLTSYAYWLLMTQWVRLPHWSAGIGWFFLAAYLALYGVLFVALGRSLVHHWRFPTIVAVPLAWVAAEVARAYLFTGWALALLGHSQVDQVPLLQCARWLGGYGVSGLVVFGAAAVEQCCWPADGTTRRQRWGQAMGALVAVASVWAWGAWLVAQEPEPAATLQVAIVQGDLDTEFGGNEERVAQAFADYRRMTAAVVAGGDVDLVIWPESMFRYGRIEAAPGNGNVRPHPDGPTWEESAQWSALKAAEIVREYRVPCLLGTDTVRQVPPGGSRPFARFNTAALLDAQGNCRDAYHKMHPVMFGEYIPLGTVFPWLYDLTPMRGIGGLTPGEEVKSFRVGDVGFVPNICFENIVPQLIRHQVHTLQSRGEPVDVLVTLTNDGWFWGSSLLDLHLACGVFRAVEHHRPLLIAANTGISAHIGASGVVRQRGPRRRQEVLVVGVNQSESPPSFYSRYGDVFGGLCTLTAGVLGLISWYQRRQIAGR